MNRQRTYKRDLLSRVGRVVIKVGSSILSRPSGIDRARVRRLVDEIDALIAGDRQVVLVSSGAVAAGTARMGISGRPRSVPQRQAAAAVGQIRLMALYEEYFGACGRIVAQILLTHDDLAHRRRYLNARHAMDELLAASVVPVVNENDTVVVEEVKRNFGDNDNLAALVATLVGADLLVMLSDVAGLHEADPRLRPDAKLIEVVPEITSHTEACASGERGPLGTGGMATKITAVHKATEAGIPCVIADGVHSGILGAIFDPALSTGTLFLPKGERLGRRKHWIAYTLQPSGRIAVDAGAYRAIVEKGRSLLPKGVAFVGGEFGAGECVSCVCPDGQEFARGLVNYNSAELDRIKGLHTSGIEGALGYKIRDEVIHRDNLVLLD